MPIGMEPNDTRFGVWQTAANKADQTLDTGKIVSTFGVPMGFHLFIERIEFVIEGGASIMLTFDSKNRVNPGSSGLAEFGEKGLDITTGGNGFMMPQGRTVWVAGLVGANERQVKFLNIPVYDTINFVKNESDDITLEFYYHFESGAMMWLDEWAALIRDKSTVPQRNTREYNQVGDYYQLGRRPIV